jgi:putative two-component system response regulator
VDQKTILIADDDVNVRNILKMICESLECLAVEAADGQEAVEVARREQPDLILMDGVMPNVDGFQATQQLKTDASTEHIPVIIVTGLQSRDDRIRGISLGANDFLTKPFDREEIALRIRNNLKIKEYNDLLQGYTKTLERQVSIRTRDLKETLDQLTEASDQIRTAYLDTIYRLTIVSEFKDEDTGAHIRRIGYYAQEIATALGMGSSYARTISHASIMHDIGKVSIPDSILLKEGRLTREEWEIMKRHTVTGALILRGASSDYLSMGEEIAMSHHERWDGSGYPEGLAGELIPISGRITNIVDVYDALRSRRPYKPAFDHEKAVAIIREGDDRINPRHFCPEVYAAFLGSVEKLREIYEQYTDTPEELSALE